MAELLDSGSPRRPLTFIGEDQDRRAQAKGDLDFALQSYTKAVSRERELDLQPLAEIWCQYAATIYDSLAKSYWGLPGEWKGLFGESGVLAGGQTRAEVEEDLKRIRVPRPDHWPDPEIYRDGDSPKIRRALGPLLIGKDVGFVHLLDEFWFMGQIRDCIAERVQHWKDRFTERQQPPAPRQPVQQHPVPQPNSAGASPRQGTAKGPIRTDRRARAEIETFATNAFAVARNRIVEEHADKKKSVLAQVARTGNSGGYLPALTKWGAERLRETILAQADAYVEAFTIHGVPSDRQAEKALETAGTQFAAGTISGILGELDLMAKRTGRPRNSSEGYLNREINHALGSALEEGKLRLQRQRITAKKAQPRPDAAPASWLPRGESRMGIPTRPLSAITADQDRQAEAQKDLKQALLSYTQNLSRAQDLDLSALAEIWGAYAVRLYDSLAESFMGLPVSREATFGEAGILAGGQTLEDVKKTLNSIRLPRPEHWPPADTSRDADDDPETVKVVRELMCSDVSFGWLLEDPWFWNQIWDHVRDGARQWMDSSTKPDRLQAISDFGASLKRISPEDPDYKTWEAFCRASHKTEARWISDSARRALQGKPLDPNGVYKFVLRLFDTAVEAQVALVTDSESAAGCEAELKTLAHGSLDYLENKLAGTCDSRTIAEWRSKLELELLHRLGKATERALAAAQQADANRARERVSSETQPAADHSANKPAPPRASGPSAIPEGGAVPVAQAPAPMNTRKTTRQRGKPTGQKKDKQEKIRSKTRSAWLDSRRTDKGWTSDLEIEANGGPTYNTIRRYRGGTKSTRDAYVRQKFAKAFGCKISDVPE